MNAILLVGHGSRDPEGNNELKEFARTVAEQAPEATIVETCFLELTRPSIAEGVTACVNRGATRVVLVPIILFAAGHAKVDIPNAIDRAKARYPQVEFVYGRPIGVHDKVIEILQTRLHEAKPVSAGASRGAVAVAAPPAPVRDEETAVLVLGRGSSDPDANSDFFKMTRMLWEKLPYKWAESCFIGVTEPLFPEGLQRCLALGAKRIIVLPYFLFTGVLIKRIDEMTAAFAAEHPEIQVELGGYFGFHPKLVELVTQRAFDALEGRVDAAWNEFQYRIEAMKHHHHHHDHHHDHDHDHHHDHNHHHDHGHHHHHEHDHFASSRDFHHDHDGEIPLSHHEKDEEQDNRAPGKGEHGVSEKQEASAGEQVGRP